MLWHHFNYTEEMTLEVKTFFLFIVFGVAPAILKEQLDDRLEKFICSAVPGLLMTESDAPMCGIDERQSPVSIMNGSDESGSIQFRVFCSLY